MKINADKHYSEKQIEQIIGADFLRKLQAINCEMTNRLMPSPDDRTEWSASLPICIDGEDYTVVAYYYTTPSDQEMVEDNGDDWGAVNWSVDHYRVI